MKYLLTLLKSTGTNWQKDNITTWSAALSYYTVFSLAPLLLLLISLAGIFISTETIQTELFTQIKGLLGEEGAVLIRDLLQNAKKPEIKNIGTIVSTIFLILGASGVFGQLQSTLNHIYKVEKKPNTGIQGIIKDKFLNFSMLLVIAFLLIVSLVASSAVSLISTFFTHLLPFPSGLLETINFIISCILISLLFFLIFKFLPYAKIPTRPLIIGAILTSLLFTIGKTAIGLYLGSGTMTSGFGAAASLALILVWVYYASLIFFFGAEFIKSYTELQKMTITPKKDAKSTEPEVKIIEKDPPERPSESLIAQIVAGIILSFFRGKKTQKGKRTKK
jgi:membrane protein